jgi:hypothetical protein
VATFDPYSTGNSNAFGNTSALSGGHSNTYVETQQSSLYQSAQLSNPFFPAAGNPQNLLNDQNHFAVPQTSFGASAQQDPFSPTSFYSSQPQHFQSHGIPSLNNRTVDSTSIDPFGMSGQPNPFSSVMSQPEARPTINQIIVANLLLAGIHIRP